MSYHVYTTTGIILRKTALGEAHSLLSVITPDFGIIHVHVTSERVMKSKLRHLVSLYSHINFSFIKTKNGFRLVTVSDTRNLFFACIPEHRTLFVQIVRFVERMMLTESPHERIFDMLSSGLSYLAVCPIEYRTPMELLCVIRILRDLGYVAETADNAFLFQAYEDFGDALLRTLDQDRERMVSTINHALRESQY